MQQAENVTSCKCNKLKIYKRNKASTQKVRRIVRPLAHKEIRIPLQRRPHQLRMNKPIKLHKHSMINLLFPILLPIEVALPCIGPATPHYALLGTLPGTVFELSATGFALSATLPDTGFALSATLPGTNSTAA